MKGRAANKELPAGTKNCRTPGDWLAFALRLYESEGIALGQIASNAHDEALYLILHTLGIPLDADPSVLGAELDAAGRRALADVFRRRIVERTPAAYITREAWLGDRRFYIDERALIPRSYFLEIIPNQLDFLLPDPARVKRVVDVCTGSACLAILLARHFPNARVDALDLSPEALEVARVNVKEYRLGSRLKLYESDVFDAVPKAKYDVILSNPPYEPTAHVDDLAAEFHKEPRMALDGGRDGLDIIRKLLRQARDRLSPDGIVLIEVGGLRRAMDKAFTLLRPQWLHTEDGSDCVCVIRAAELLSAPPVSLRKGG